MRRKQYRIGSTPLINTEYRQVQGCTRSHPHDNPCQHHDLLTKIARLENENASLRAMLATTNRIPQGVSLEDLKQVPWDL